MNNLTQKGGRRNAASKIKASARKSMLQNAEITRLVRDLGVNVHPAPIIQPEIFQLQNELRSNWPNTTDQLDFNNFDYTPVLQNPYMAFAKSAPMMYGVYPALAALAARSLYNNYYASGGKTKKRSQRKRQTRKRQ